MALFSCGCCIGRRQFLAGGLAAATALPARRVFAQAPAVKTAKRIDMHHHFLPPAYIKEEHERINFGHGAVSANQLLSWSPTQSLEADGRQRHLDRDRFGEHARAVVRRRRRRPPAVADVERLRRRADPQLSRPLWAVRGYPLPDTEGSLAEIAYALDTLKADGIGLLISYDGKYSATFLAPVFRNHPSQGHRLSPARPRRPVAAPCSPACRRRPSNIIESTRTITSVLVSGMLNNPDIRWIFSHGGGATPMLAGRWSRRWAAIPMPPR